MAFQPGGNPLGTSKPASPIGGGGGSMPSANPIASSSPGSVIKRPVMGKPPVGSRSPLPKNRAAKPRVLTRGR